MASKSKSRWADDEEDAALEAQLKKEKEEKKRLKAEKARKLEAEGQAREAQAAKPQTTTKEPLQREPLEDGEDTGGNGPPAKRRRLSPEREASAPAAGSSINAGSLKLPRIEGGTFGRCRSVENYDKLNDIEEGAYGWVARAQEHATGKVVALKRLKIDPKDRSGLPVTGLREIQILKDCDHRNIVKLREVVVGDDTSRIEKYIAPFTPSHVSPAPN